MPADDTSTISAPSSSDDCGKQENSAHPRHFSVQETAARHDVTFPFSVAAPSFVIPAGAADNCRFLAPYFDEIGLLFFEAEACLRYTEDDLPPDLAGLDVDWHVHLPLDLDWSVGMDAVWGTLSRLMDKAAFLSPQAWVLHPPPPGLLKPLAERLRDAGHDPADVLLENVEESDLRPVWDEARQAGYSTCLDLGHILAYGQHPLLALDGLAESVRMLHIYAPDGSRHTGLNRLDEPGLDLLCDILGNFQPRTVMLEIFNEQEIFKSIELLAQWTARWSA